MDEKTLIRKYEELKSRKSGTLKEKLQLEEAWIVLFTEMDRSLKLIAKKRKQEMINFANKAEDEAEKISKEIFEMLIKKSTYSFSSLKKENRAIYVKRGVKGLIQIYSQLTGDNKTFDEYLEDKTEQEQKESVPYEEWVERVKVFIKNKYTTLADALKLQKEQIELFAWWDARSKKEQLNKVPALQSTYALLCNYADKTAQFAIQEMGYNFTFEDIAKKGKRKDAYRRNGLTAFFKKLEEEGNSKFLEMVTEQLLQHIAIQHPKEEFNTGEMKRKFIIHEGRTNTGKTYHAVQALRNSNSGAYLAPIRLMAAEIQERLSAEGVACDLVTGEETIFAERSNHRSSTIETAALNRTNKVGVIDEMQMIEDPKRGHNWLRAIFGMKAEEIHLCGAPHATPFMKKLIQECGDTFEVKTYERQTELVKEEAPFLYPSSAQKGDALIVFSKRRVLEVAADMERTGLRVSIIYGDLPVNIKREQVEKFAKGESDVIVGTDAIGIGLNLPIRRVVFIDTEKYDGDQMRFLTVQEVKQIAGRAGRRGMYEVGYVNALENKEKIFDYLDTEDEVIQKSVLAPDESVTKLPIGMLRHRLLAWQKANIDVPYLEKADISQELDLLKYIEKWEFEMDVDTILKTLQIPFNTKENHLLKLWMSYVEQLKDGKASLERPKFRGTTRQAMEAYYHQLNLYYNFSKKFKLEMDRRWVHHEKKHASASISRMMSAPRQRKLA